MNKLFISLGLVLLLLVGCSESKEPTIEITQEAINNAVETTELDDMVKDAAVSVEEGTITLAIIANSSVNEDYAKELADNFARQLASFSEGESPSKDYLGEIFEQYDLLVGVFGSDESKIVQGAKVKSANKITW